MGVIAVTIGAVSGLVVVLLFSVFEYIILKRGGNQDKFIEYFPSIIFLLIFLVVGFLFYFYFFYRRRIISERPVLVHAPGYENEVTTFNALKKRVAVGVQ